MELVKFEKINKIYKTGNIEVDALKNINLKIDRGEFLVFAGPSGAGKTTMLNMVGVMDKPTNGKLFVDNEDVTKFNLKEAANFRKHKLGFIFQSYNLIPVLTAYENVAFTLQLLKKYSSNQIKDMVENVFSELEILELKNRKPSEMSGGQQQRVAIARAIVKMPKIILADEPTANLDTKTGESILRLMQKLNEEKDITFIFSSHDSKIIDKAKRIVWIRDGEREKKEHNF